MREHLWLLLKKYKIVDPNLGVPHDLKLREKLGIVDMIHHFVESMGDPQKHQSLQNTGSPVGGPPFFDKLS